MIGDFIFLVASLLLGILSVLFGAISYVLPVGFFSAIVYFLGHFLYLKGWFDVDTFFQVVGVWFVGITAIYLFKIILWAYSLIPWIGRRAHLPKLGHKSGS